MDNTEFELKVNDYIKYVIGNSRISYRKGFSLPQNEFSEYEYWMEKYIQSFANENGSDIDFMTFVFVSCVRDMIRRILISTV